MTNRSPSTRRSNALPSKFKYVPNSPTKDADNRKIDIAIAKYQLANVRNILESEAQWNRSKKQLLIEGRLGTNRRTELVEELAGMRSLS